MPPSPAHQIPTTSEPAAATRAQPWPGAAPGLVCAVLLCLAGCGGSTVVVYQQEPPPQTTTVQQAPAPVYYQPPPPPPPQPQQQVVVEQQWDDEETNTVIYREYYGCTEDEIYDMPHYRHYYQVDNDDLFFVCFVARQAQVPFSVAFNQWYFGCGRDCNRLVAFYRVDPAVFFVATPPGYYYPPIYAHAYYCYNNQQLVGASFSPGEFHALVSLRIGVEYQGVTADVFFRNTVTYGSPSRAVYYNRERCGMGGHGCAGLTIRIGVRPWTLNARDRAAWRQDNANRRSMHEARFREAHHDDLVRVQHGEGARRDDQRMQRQPGDRPGERPGDRPGERLGDRPGDRPGERPGDRQVDHPGDRPGDRPGERPDQQRQAPRQPGDRPEPKTQERKPASKEPEGKEKEGR